MKQVVFVSGKGGTGKSTVAACLSLLVREKMLADCDVDAPNLHLLLPGERLLEEDFSGASEAVIDPSACVQCGICRETCRFDAITGEFKVNSLRCEGCGACMLACPQGAIRLEAVKTGETYVDRTARGTFSHALLDISAEGSGKLVTQVRKNMTRYESGEPWALIDGAPGIGCIVIASITGADAVVAVCEPTLSGKSDLVRVLDVARHFGIPAFVCINKHDLNPGITGEIEQYCEKNGFPVIARLLFDPAVVHALRELKTPVEAGLTAFTREIESLWNRLKTNSTIT